MKGVCDGGQFKSWRGEGCEKRRVLHSVRRHRIRGEAYVEFDPDVFRGKTILLPCDDPEWSNFTKYFAANFTRFGLKKLISTSYAKSAGSQQLTLFEPGVAVVRRRQA